jgi:hypothetical protein
LTWIEDSLHQPPNRIAEKSQNRFLFEHWIRFVPGPEVKDAALAQRPLRERDSQALALFGGSNAWRDVGYPMGLVCILNHSAT